MTRGDWATIVGVHAAADRFWQRLMELPQSLPGLRQRLSEAGESWHDIRQRLKDSGNN